MPTPIDGAGLGQNQFYSVVFDGEGDAIVAAKLKIQNIGIKETIAGDFAVKRILAMKKEKLDCQK